MNFLSKRAEHVLWWIHYQPEQLDEALDEGRLRNHLRTLFPLKKVNESTLLHGDFWSGNLIWRHGRLTRVIDWEDAEIGDPLSDLSITRLDMLWGSSGWRISFASIKSPLARSCPNVSMNTCPARSCCTAFTVSIITSCHEGNTTPQKHCSESDSKHVVVATSSPYDSASLLAKHLFISMVKQIIFWGNFEKCLISEDTNKKEREHSVIQSRSYLSWT